MNVWMSLVNTWLTLTLGVFCLGALVSYVVPKSIPETSILFLRPPERVDHVFMTWQVLVVGFVILLACAGAQWYTVGVLASYLAVTEFIAWFTGTRFAQRRYQQVVQLRQKNRRTHLRMT